MLIKQKFDPIWSQLLYSTNSSKRPPKVHILAGRLQETKILSELKYFEISLTLQYMIHTKEVLNFVSVVLQVYQANSDQNTVVVNTLESPIEARFIRLHPQQWYGHISTRIELYGCAMITGMFWLKKKNSICNFQMELKKSKSILWKIKNMSFWL